VISGPSPDTRTLADLAGRVMQGEGLTGGMSLAVRVMGDEEIRALNREFLGVNEPTDVLAFPDDADSEFIVPRGESDYLGDIAISLSTAVAQAAELGHSLDAELSHLLVHGILHLCGFDHVTGQEDESRMLEREEFYLGDLGTVHRHRT